MIYEGTVSYVNLDDKTVKMNMVVADAVSFADAERQMEVAFHGETDLEVVALKRSKIKEIANASDSGEDLIWLATLSDSWEMDGKEKHIKYDILLHAPDFESAKGFIEEYITQGYNMELISLKLTSFLVVVS